MTNQILKPLAIALMLVLVPVFTSAAQADQDRKGEKNQTGELPVHFVGETHAGGIVFYVSNDGQHGLIAAKANQSNGIQWYNGTYRLTGATGDGLGAGAMNTAMIISAQISDNQVGSFAAKVTADYSVQENGSSACTGSALETCYGDWYLPSKAELNLLFQHRNVLSGLATDYYWSSTEINSLDGNAWIQDFGSGVQGIDGKVSTLSVRAIRAF